MSILKRKFKQLLGFFPSRLPTGMAEFDTWSADLTSTYTLPTASASDIKFVLSTSIMHLGPTSAYKSKYYFYLLINAAAAKQIASEQFRAYKELQQAEAAASKAAASNAQA